MLQPTRPEPVRSRLPSVMAALLLAGYFGVSWAWLSPSTDPQGGMANGFLMLVTVCLLGLAGLLWLGIRSQRRGLVWFVFGVCALPSLSLVARGVYLLVRWLRRE
jgi:hypothetical protein